MAVSEADDEEVAAEELMPSFAPVVCEGGGMDRGVEERGPLGLVLAEYNDADEGEELVQGVDGCVD